MMSVMVDERQRLKATFDSAAHLYQQPRPEYPSALYDELSHLAAEALRNLAQFGNVQVINAPFESWHPPRERAFALVFAATA
jgi:hypothetical protein